MTKEELWQAVLADIQFHISRANFTTWLANTEIISKQDKCILVSVPNSFSKEWLENKYNKLILKALYNINNDIKEVKYEVKPCALKTLDHLASTDLPKPKLEQLNFQEFKINKKTNLNPRYTFDNFVIGSFNELAQAAAWAVSKKPGLVYNPLFIYGNVGLGKTHLLQAIGNKIIEKSASKNVLYIPAEKFTSEVVSSIRNGTIESLKAKFRQTDVLILDDAQFLAGKEKTQEEFFHTFNSLYEKNKQIILSSDRSPKAIPALEERLRSRFEGGMIADISAPDYETRLAILKTKGQEKKIDLSNETLEYIASNVQKNIREMEGALNSLAAYQKLNNEQLDAKIARKLLKNLISSPPKIVSPKIIIQMVAEFFDLKERDLITPSRKKEIVRPRQIAMYLLRNELKSSFPFIGRKFSGKDHTTAIYACTKIKKEIENSEKFTDEINLIKQRIYSQSC
ncbi:chromosomal replication initiator protein DnaA [Candidatus Parcubacteria bacterium]|nr:chromosomal replication initiator protein DnaA [Candidatus Parcubacteria bacterium]